MGFCVDVGLCRISLNLFFHRVSLKGNGVNTMGSRQNLRVDCYSPCTLNVGCSHYRAILVNISLGGALISAEGDVLGKLHIGDKFDLMLCENPDLCLAKYSCKVISQNSSKIGVKFQGIH